MFVDVVKVFIL